MNMVWGSGFGTPMPTYEREPGREYTPSRSSGTTNGFGMSTSGTKTASQIIQETIDARRLWNDSDIGRDQNAVNESVTAYARKQADSQMENAKRALDNQVATLKQQGRYQEAQIRLEEGNQKIARERLAQEMQIRQQELQLSRERFGLEQELGRGNLQLGRDRFGVEKAQALTEYLKTPDQYFSQRNFRNALGNILGGGGAESVTQTAAQYGGPQMKTTSDFEAIAGPSGSLASGAGGPAAGAGPSPGMPNAGAGASNDPRQTAAAGVLKALQPSEANGLDENDVAALNAIYNIYSARKPGSVERLGTPRRKIAQAGLAALGFDPETVEWDYQQAGVGQGNPRAA